MDIDLDDQIENSEQPDMDLIVSDFGNSAPNLAPKRKEKKAKKGPYVQKTKPITLESVGTKIEEFR